MKCVGTFVPGDTKTFHNKIGSHRRRQPHKGSMPVVLIMPSFGRKEGWFTVDKCFLSPIQQCRTAIEHSEMERHEGSQRLARHCASRMVAPRKPICSLGDHSFPTDMWDVQQHASDHFQFAQQQHQAKQLLGFGSTWPEGCVGGRVVGEHKDFRILEFAGGAETFKVLHHIGRFTPVGTLLERNQGDPLTELKMDTGRVLELRCGSKRRSQRFSKSTQNCCSFPWANPSQRRGFARAQFRQHSDIITQPRDCSNQRGSPSRVKNLCGCLLYTSPSPRD